MAIAEDLDRATDSQWDWVAEHTRTYLASGGSEGHERDGVRTLVLATTGRRTGTPRRTCLSTAPRAASTSLSPPRAVPSRTRHGW